MQLFMQHILILLVMNIDMSICVIPKFIAPLWCEVIVYQGLHYVPWKCTKFCIQFLWIYVACYFNFFLNYMSVQKITFNNTAEQIIVGLV